MKKFFVVSFAALLVLALAFRSVRGEEYESEYCVNGKCLKCPSGCDLNVSAPVVTSDTRAQDLDCECVCGPGETQACIGSSSTIATHSAWMIVAILALIYFI